jgi:hypothetical protein
MQLVFDKNYLIHFHTAGSYVKLHPSLVAILDFRKHTHTQNKIL